MSLGADIFLYRSAVPIVDIILSDPRRARHGQRPGDDKPEHHRSRFLPRGKPLLERHREPVVVAVALMDNLVDEYGVIHGREVYFAMQREMKGPFAPGNKYDVTTRPAVDVEPAHPIHRAPPARRT